MARTGGVQFEHFVTCLFECDIYCITFFNAKTFFVIYSLYDIIIGPVEFEAILALSSLTNGKMDHFCDRVDKAGARAKPRHVKDLGTDLWAV